MAKNALILGAPRSGTSLASSIFARAGYYVGHIGHPKQRLGDDHNPYGYFEADELIERNAQVLRRAGYKFHNTWTFERITPDVVRRIATLVPSDGDREFVRRYEAKAPWLWKDPRFCFTLPYWWKLLDPGSVVAYLTTRNVRNAYPSFRRKGWCKRGAAERRRVTDLVMQHSLAARRAVAELRAPHVTVDYSDYTREPVLVARRVSEAFEIELSVEALNFHPELNHSGLRGNISTPIRAQLKRLPRRWVERVADAIPKPVLGLLFPERLHQHERAPRCGTESATRVEH